MHGHDGRDLFLLDEFLNDIHHLELVLYVEVAGGLVQKKHLRLLCQRPRHGDLLFFTTAQLVEVSRCELLDPHEPERPGHDLHIVAGDTPADVRSSSHEHYIEDRVGKDLQRALRNISHHLGEVLGAQQGRFLPIDEDRSLLGFQYPVYAFDEGALPRTIRTHQADDLAFVDLHGDILQDICTPIAEAEIFDFESHCHHRLFLLTSR